jgi:FKBP-type peptidyl-prolyl cis-trans isomerase (trigger factor)
MALKKVGEIAVLEEAVELFVRDFYPELIEAQKIDAVGRPDIRITKLAPGNPVGLTIRAAVYPDVQLPKDWKTTGNAITLEKAAEATNEEVNKTVEDLRQSRKKDDTVPELTDEFAKTLGAFENVDALKAQIKKGIGEEKERAARDARRGKIIDALLTKTIISVPNIFVESELDKILSQMRDDISRMGLQFEEYLKRVGKTEETIRAEFRDQAAKRAKLQLTLNKIAQEEKIEPEKEAVDHEMTHALEHFKDANKTLLRVHIESVLRNEKVLKLIEGNT